MAKIDKIKEFIGWLKVLFALFFGIDVSLIAYLFLHFEENFLFKDIIVIFIPFYTSYIMQKNIGLFYAKLQR